MDKVVEDLQRVRGFGGYDEQLEFHGMHVAPTKSSVTDDQTDRRSYPYVALCFGGATKMYEFHLFDPECDTDLEFAINLSWVLYQVKMHIALLIQTL